jgi:hypothetical protein
MPSASDCRRSGADRRSTKNAAKPLNQSREAHHSAGRSTPPRGANVTLEDRGMYLLKGIDGDWQLHAVARP